MSAATEVPVVAAMGPEERIAFLDGLSRVVHANRAYLAAIARGEGVAPEDALDVVQEAFFKLITAPEAPSLLGAPAEARAFVAAIARNLARNHRRLHAVARPHVADEETVDGLADEDPPADELVAAAEERMRLLGCVRTLEKVQRAVVTLRVLDDVPGEDVARELGLSKGHVAVLLHRAKRHLVACMAEMPG